VSTLVELSPELYSAAAFAAFDPAANFSIGNARVLMWFSQLAYEADTTPNPTIAVVSRLWGFTSVTPFAKQKVAVPTSFETIGLVGERPDAVILAFAGTDPAVWQTLVTDANVRLTRDNDTHIGFQTALDEASGEIKQAVALSRQSNKPLFVTGHSLGAARWRRWLRNLPMSFRTAAHRSRQVLPRHAWGVRRVRNQPAARASTRRHRQGKGGRRLHRQEAEHRRGLGAAVDSRWRGADRDCKAARHWPRVGLSTSWLSRPWQVDRRRSDVAVISTGLSATAEISREDDPSALACSAQVDSPSCWYRRLNAERHIGVRSIPLSNVVPALVIDFISLAYLEDDGLLLSLALPAAVLVLTVVSLVAWEMVVGAKLFIGLW
jgi:hypothetical protein